MKRRSIGAGRNDGWVRGIGIVLLVNGFQLGFHLIFPDTWFSGLQNAPMRLNGSINRTPHHLDLVVRFDLTHVCEDRPCIPDRNTRKTLAQLVCKTEFCRQFSF